MSRIQKLFELQVYTSGQWKIDSVYDDSEIAISEAERMEHAKRYTGIRVVEEVYDEVKQKTSLRTIHRSDRVVDANAQALKKSIRHREEVKARNTEHQKVMTIKAAKERKAETRSAMTKIAIALVILIALGLALMIGLRYLNEMI